MSSEKKIELLAPAGSPEVLDAAIGEGADAVYLGLQDFNARKRAKNFTYKQFEAAVQKLHSMDKKIYLALNTVFQESEAKSIYNILKYVSIVRPDGIIVQDLGIVRLVRKYFPDIRMHASTQMNVSTANGVNMLSKYGIKRVVLGRELTYEELKAIRYGTNTELEIFVHGALCISVSGLCLFSSYLGGKSANRGACAQPCRRLYQNEKKKGYFFSPNDLMLIEKVPDIIELGMNSIKIEGRMRSAQYVASVVRAYRYVIDNCGKDPDAVRIGKDILKEDFARGKTRYFFDNIKNRDFINPGQTGGTGIFLGSIIRIEKKEGERVGLIPFTEKLGINDSVRIHTKDDLKRGSVKIKEIQRSRDGIYINVPEEFNEGDEVFLINLKEQLKKYPHIIPKDISAYKRHPGNNEMPAESGKEFREGALSRRLPSGIYVKINLFKDIYVTQAVKPVKLIISLTKGNHADLRNNLKSTSYQPDDIIIDLGAVSTGEKDELYKVLIKESIAHGYRSFIVNNIGQFGLFRDRKGIELIAGPYLYMFNRHAITLLSDAGCGHYISPLENSMKNLSASTESADRNRFFVVVFSYPSLFQIRRNLNDILDIKSFHDKMSGEFKLISFDENSIVIPERPFSIVDKLQALKKSGFNRFILDLSFTDPKKNFYKNVFTNAQKGDALEGSSRFNWKDGFYREAE